MPNDLDPRWYPVFDAAGLTRRSFRAVSDESGVSTSAVSNALSGGGPVQDKTLRAIAKALKIQPHELRNLIAEVSHPPFRLPIEADQLDRDERDAVLGVIRAILRAKKNADQSARADRSAGVDDAPPPLHLADAARTENITKTSGRVQHNDGVEHVDDEIGEESQDVPADPDAGPTQR